MTLTELPIIIAYICIHVNSKKMGIVGTKIAIAELAKAQVFSSRVFKMAQRWSFETQRLSKKLTTLC